MIVLAEAVRWATAQALRDSHNHQFHAGRRDAFAEQLPTDFETDSYFYKVVCPVCDKPKQTNADPTGATSLENSSGSAPTTTDTGGTK